MWTRKLIPLDDDANFDLSWKFEENVADPAVRKTLDFLKSLHLEIEDDHEGFSEQNHVVFFAHADKAEPESFDTLGSKSSEISSSIIDFYGILWRFKSASNLNDENYSGSLVRDSNLYSYSSARDYLTGKMKTVQFTSTGKSRLLIRQAPVPPGTDPALAQNYYKPVAFYSEDTHYSISKSMALLDLQSFSDMGGNLYPHQCPITSDGSWPDYVPTDVFGNLSIDALAQLVDFFASKGHPIMVSLDYGSSSRGGYDDVKKINEALLPVFEKNGLMERPMPNCEQRLGYWIHVDASDHLAYLKEAESRGYTYRDGSPVIADISFDGIQSMASKGIGRTSVFMTKTKYQIAPPDIPEYIGHLPEGSNMISFRGQMAPPELPRYIGTPDILTPETKDAVDSWIQLAKGSVKEEIDIAMNRMEMAGLLEKGMKNIANDLGVDLWVERAPLGLSVLFQELNADLMKKHKLSLEKIVVGEDQRRYSIATATKNVDKRKVESLLHDIKKAGADAFADSSLKNAIATEKHAAKPPEKHGQGAEFSHSHHAEFSHPHHAPGPGFSHSRHHGGF